PAPSVPPRLSLYGPSHLPDLHSFPTRRSSDLLPLARLRKEYIHNIFRKRWYVETPAGQRTAMAVEDSMVLSLLRRVLGSLFGLRSEEHTSELQSRFDLVCRLLLEKKKTDFVHE